MSKEHVWAPHWVVGIFTLAFELCWRGLLRVPWTARSNQSILKKINCKYSLEGLMLKLQYFGHLMWRANSLKKTWMLGKIERAGGEGGDRGWDGWMASLTQWTWIWANPGRWWRTERPGVLQSVESQRVRHDLATEQHSVYGRWREELSPGGCGGEAGRALLQLVQAEVRFQESGDWFFLTQ